MYICTCSLTLLVFKIVQDDIVMLINALNNNGVRQIRVFIHKSSLLLRETSDTVCHRRC